MIIKSTKAILYQKFMQTGDDPSDVVCHYIPNPTADVDVAMAVGPVEKLPDSNIYPCLAFSQRYIYNVIHTDEKGSREYIVQAIPVMELPHLRA